MHNEGKEIVLRLLDAINDNVDPETVTVKLQYISEELEELEAYYKPRGGESPQN